MNENARHSLQIRPVYYLANTERVHSNLICPEFKNDQGTLTETLEGIENDLALRQKTRLIENKLSLTNRAEAHTCHSAVSTQERKRISITGRGSFLSGDLLPKSPNAHKPCEGCWVAQLRG